MHASRARGKDSPTACYLGWVVAGQAGYVALVGGDWMPHYRFLLPVLPLLLALMQEGWFVLADRLAERISAPRLGAAAVVFVLFGIYLVPMREALEFSELRGTFFNAHDARRIGLYLDANLSADQMLAVEWAGILPYHTHHRVLDTWGLTDRDIPQQPFLKQVWGTRINPWYLAERAPDLITGCARTMPSEEAARASIRPDGPNHYSYYPKMATPRFGYEWKMFRIADDAWWPALVRRSQ